MTFDQAWKNADPDAVGSDTGEPPEPGTYTAALMNAEAFLSKAKEAWVKLVWKIEAGDWTVLLGFKSQGQANFAKNQIRELGVDVDGVSDLDELNAALTGVEGSFFDVEVVQNGEYRNTYVRGKAPESSVPSLDAAITSGQIPTEDVPF